MTIKHHEAMHMAAFCAGMVRDKVAAHPIVKERKEWLDLAHQAEDVLTELFRRIDADSGGTTNERAATLSGSAGVYRFDESLRCYVQVTPDPA